MSRWGGTALADALREGHTKVAKELFARGARLMYDEATASGALCELARVGDLERIRLMLEIGVDPNASDCALMTGCYTRRAASSHTSVLALV